MRDGHPSMRRFGPISACVAGVLMCASVVWARPPGGGGSGEYACLCGANPTECRNTATGPFCCCCRPSVSSSAWKCETHTSDSCDSPTAPRDSD